mgnify:CR=1 FL=1
MRLLLLTCLLSLSSALAAQAEIAVWRGSATITSGSTETVQYTGISPFNLTYTVTNLGTSDLLPSGVVISDEENCSITILVDVPSPVVNGSPATFTIQVAPVSSGAFSFTLSIANNDADENPFSWTFDGHTAKPSSGGGGDGGGGDCSTGSQPHTLWPLALFFALLALVGRNRRRAHD